MKDRYNVTRYSVQYLLGLIDQGFIAIPEGIFEMEAEDYDEFLAQRRRLMARKIQRFFKSL